MLAYRDLTRLDKILDGSSCSAACRAGAWGYLPLGSGCALKASRVSCLVITLSSSSAPASLSRSIMPISGRICSWVSSRSCSGVWAGTERAVAERRRLVMIRPSLLLRLDNVASAARFLLGHIFRGISTTLRPRLQLTVPNFADCLGDAVPNSYPKLDLVWDNAIAGRRSSPRAAASCESRPVVTRCGGAGYLLLPQD